MVLHVRGTVLPEREVRSLWIDGGVLREDPVAGAETVADGGWLVPGLVDVHTHPGAERPGDPFDESVLRSTSRITPPRACCWSAHPGPRPASRAGLTTRRACPGCGPRGPGWPRRAGSSRAGGRRVSEAGLARAAVQEEAAAAQAAAGVAGDAAPATQPPGPPETDTPAPPPPAAAPPAAPPAASTAPAPGAPRARPRRRAGTAPVAGWCKIIGDWAWDEPPVPLAVLRDVTSAVHAIGGKVSVHAQTAAGCAHAVAAGVDSLEHGMHLDPGLLDQMAAQGTAQGKPSTRSPRVRVPGPCRGPRARPRRLPGRWRRCPAPPGPRTRRGSRCWPEPTRTRAGWSPRRSSG